ncbi:DUF3597 domain-containing protein [Mycetohabitans endofungorum]|uniref:DUF3597 domain-containing protein n=1 Tax=Mycetohabitans endofungorum TaxID=417203 RepID=UPI0030D3B080
MHRFAGTRAGPGSHYGVDVSAVLDARVRESGRVLDWRRSLTNLLAALDIDDSLEQRSRLAGELGCNGPIDDPATIERLHGKLMHALAANGGKVPRRSIERRGVADNETD